jgi:hypothetical protein
MIFCGVSGVNQSLTGAGHDRQVLIALTGLVAGYIWPLSTGEPVFYPPRGPNGIGYVMGWCAGSVPQLPALCAAQHPL